MIGSTILGIFVIMLVISKFGTEGNIFIAGVAIGALIIFMPFIAKFQNKQRIKKEQKALEKYEKENSENKGQLRR